MSKRMSMARREELRDETITLVRMAELFHETGLDLSSRTLFMGSEWVDVEGGEGGTDAIMAERVIKNLHLLENVSHRPITIIVNNLGGDEYHGMAMFDAIKQSPCSVTMIVRGHAMSMGSILLQAADERVMGPCATQMVHYGTFASYSHSKDFQRHARESLRLDHWMEGVYLDRIRQKQPKYTLKKLRALLRFDKFMTAQQSIDLGLADRIG